ncbi:hypothetical protein N0B31_01985 [Salinirubellus salinus]|uniref:Uncharacterized protein n=1 Tax=Salinirubellus salinus TaxID=1364945 RepID=A0A9E7R3Y0_9EURY|nr:hypothetical protein [Salinirubellus salinus]UWM55061.1 hypothetical protein N0B31_01985 [Salinirubellus salinus]
MADLLRTLTERLAEGRDLDVAADLDVELDGVPLHVEAYTDLVVVTLPSLSLGRRLVGHHGDRSADVAALLDAADLTAEVRVGPRPVARLGADVTPGPLERRLGLGSIRLVPRGLLLAALLD